VVIDMPSHLAAGAAAALRLGAVKSYRYGQFATAIRAW
jgi:hypothetical protein